MRSSSRSFLASRLPSSSRLRRRVARSLSYQPIPPPISQAALRRASFRLLRRARDLVNHQRALRREHQTSDEVPDEERRRAVARPRRHRFQRRVQPLRAPARPDQIQQRSDERQPRDPRGDVRRRPRRPPAPVRRAPQHVRSRDVRRAPDERRIKIQPQLSPFAPAHRALPLRGRNRAQKHREDHHLEQHDAGEDERGADHLQRASPSRPAVVGEPQRPRLFHRVLRR
mmetsp:Transcript_3937/g.13642  ORF Transcript_3937/g.13642 Transcript_3937/m.13642 type:complete len:228 (+) Transcript_3937:1110-1793(+)